MLNMLQREVKIYMDAEIKIHLNVVDVDIILSAMRVNNQFI